MAAAYTLIWLPEQQAYALSLRGQTSMQLFSGEDERWFAWLATCSSFAFQGQSGHLTLRKETRKRGKGYWYAYRTRRQRTRKRYAGRSDDLTPARLEACAASFTDTEHASTSLPIPVPLPNLSPVLEPKLHLPHLQDPLVTRSRLLTRLNAALQHKMILISAPAGFGKTILVRQWIETQSQDTQTAWLSLDPEDDDPIRFWHYVLTACLAFSGQPSQHALRHLSTDGPFFPLSLLKKILTAFLNDLIKLPSPCLLVLEDYHVITSSQIHESLAFVIDHLPPTLHLVLTTRAEPPLPLASWRAHRELVELRANELRFSHDEITTFLHQALPFALPTELLQPLEAHMEGWPTGYLLLSLALQGKSERKDIEQVLANFSGSHRYVLDYFALDVLSAQPKAFQRFLLQTSLLGRMTSSLCAAVTGYQNSQQLLSEAERAGLFLQALGGEPAWYRYHALFAEALQEEARHRLEKEEWQGCLSRASTWYEQHGMFAEGIEAALEAEAWTRAATMMERFLNMQNRSIMYEHATVLRWLERLPDQTLETHPGLCINYAAALLFTLDRYSPATMALIEELLSRAERLHEREEAWDKLSEALSCHAEVARWQGNVPQAIRLARQALHLPADSQAPWQGTSIVALATGELCAGRPQEARRLMLEGMARFETPLPWYDTRGVAFTLADISLRQGELRQAEQSYRHLLATANDNPVERVQAHLGLAQLAYEWNDLIVAGEHVAQALELGRTHLEELGPYYVETGIRFPCELLQARLQQARGNYAQALQTLQALVSHAQEQLWNYRYYVQLWSYLYRVALAQQAELSLACGELTAVERWQETCRQLGEHFHVFQQEQEALLCAHFLILRGEIPQALHLLKRWQDDARANRRLRSELEISLLMALAYAASSQPSQAEQALTEALRLGQAQSFQRLFLEKGETLATLLRAYLLDAREESLICYGRDVLRAFAGSGTKSYPASQATSIGLWESLTEAEQRVLGLLVAGRSNPQIAEALVVSINTIKTHVQSIYRKLGVKSRWEACEAARRLDIF
ncbi:hypothetical protein EPA93_06295 [Ktedonosporobacter rubrisoli]|uniref:HTH luxR-type domain-containing protein n=1 Tax=Ktedonosporobacter rubrisoli TaxID=2509675 RepID=A0A4P6JKF8_KTERU|nr:LuxR C-terminal-related transcriptional regulator [Ktedonosporobacter rubrisoli]QBD75635.1 hypothetical protein EPA93_06295 [Ktedonosporobacter rubrisoli]